MPTAMPTIKRACEEHEKRGYGKYKGPKLSGPRHVIPLGSAAFPKALANIPRPPECLYAIGNVEALEEGLAVIGARKATPYGRECARHFAGIAAAQGITIVSGGALGCDSEAHRAALEQGGSTVVFLGGGCDCVYPASHYRLFQKIIDSGGVVASEYEWEYPPLPYGFRERNRLIAGLARATLIVEAGLPSGTFSTADEALAASKDVLVIPGAITSSTSAGSNRLLYQGATPVVDDETFSDILFDLFGCLKMEQIPGSANAPGGLKAIAYREDPLYQALMAQPMRKEQMLGSVRVPKGEDGRIWIAVRLAELEADGLVARYPDGRYGPAKL